MNQRIAIHLAGRRHKQSSIVAQCQLNAATRPQASDIECLNRKPKIVLGRRRACKIHDRIDGTIDIEGLRDVVFNQRESRCADEMLDMCGIAGDVVVNTHHLIAPLDECIAHMAAQKPCATGDDIATHF